MKNLILTIAFAFLAVLALQDARTSRQNAAQAREQASAIAAELEDAKAALERSQRVSNDRAKVVANYARQIKSLKQGALVAQKELEDALKANSDWADDRVPDGVWDSLFPKPAP